MKIAIIGNFGVGKTSTRLRLTSMLPQYDTAIVNAEGQCFVGVGNKPNDMALVSRQHLVARLNHSNDFVASVAYPEDLTDIQCDHILWVKCGRDQQRARIIERSTEVTPEFLERLDKYLNMQSPDDKMRQLATHVIDNTGTPNDLSDSLIKYATAYQLRPDTWSGN